MACLLELSVTQMMSHCWPPTSMALNAMLGTCTRFADAHNLLFNSPKTKCMFIYKSGTQLHSNVRFMGKSFDFVDSVDLLGVPLYADLKVHHLKVQS